MLGTNLTNFPLWKDSNDGEFEKKCRKAAIKKDRGRCMSLENYEESLV